MIKAKNMYLSIKRNYKEEIEYPVLGLSEPISLEFFFLLIMLLYAALTRYWF